MGVSCAYNAADGEILRRVNSFEKDPTESETMSMGKCRANLKASINMKGPRPEVMILERNLSFKSLVEDKEQHNSPTKTKSSINLKGPKPKNVVLDWNLSFKGLVQVEKRDGLSANCPNKGKMGTTQNLATLSLPEPAPFWSPRPVTELNVAAVKLQKVYKSYRTRRNLADCAVVVEELWWKALDFAALERSSMSFFNHEKPETAISKWARARTKAAKVGKGLCKDDKAHILALQHWLEAIDPRHRYGHNLHLYYDVWFESESSQPFFFWLDVGDGKEVNIDKCPRTILHRQCITYLGPKEREAYEVVVEEGKLVYRQSKMLVETKEGSKWIFVLSTTRTLYVGQKQKGLFQHSSFLSGAAISAAGRLVAHAGALQAIWPYSGHYLPTEENFREFICFLEENNVDLANVKMCAIDDDNYVAKKDGRSEPSTGAVEATKTDGLDETDIVDIDHEESDGATVDPAVEFKEQKRLSCKWTTGAGPRIGCVRDYPAELQTRALEQVNLSPRLVSGPVEAYGPVPSPRPCPSVRLSPRLFCMGLPSPRS